MKIRSLRMRSLTTIVAVVLPLMATYTWLSHTHVSYQLGQRFDGRMRGELRMLEVAVHKSGGDAARLEEIANLLPIDTFPQRRAFGVWAGTELLLATLRQPFTAAPRLANGFTDLTVGKQQYRVLAKVLPPAPPWNRSLVLAVADHMPTRSALIRSAMFDVLVPLIIGAPLAVLGIYIALVKGLSPLTRLAEQIRSRSAQQLEPIAADDVPIEALPIAQSVNQLMARVGESLERERRFTADAAHELKTPLTALKAHAQVALQTQDEALRHASLRDIARTVNRTDRLITQLLTLARLDPSVDSADCGQVDLASITSATLAELQETAAAREQQLHLRVDENVHPRAVVHGNADALAILIRNIVENAVHYSEQQGAIEVRVLHRDRFGIIEVSDRGPGIPAEARQEVFRRFHRVAGTKAPGTGLGLSIVQRIAEIHRGHVTLQDGDAGIGLCVVVAIPLAT